MARSMERDDDSLDLANPSSAFCCLKMFFSNQRNTPRLAMIQEITPWCPRRFFATGCQRFTVYISRFVEHGFAAKLMFMPIIGFVELGVSTNLVFVYTLLYPELRKLGV